MLIKGQGKCIGTDSLLTYLPRLACVLLSSRSRLEGIARARRAISEAVFYATLKPDRDQALTDFSVS